MRQFYSSCSKCDVIGGVDINKMFDPKTGRVINYGLPNGWLRREEGEEYCEVEYIICPECLKKYRELETKFFLGFVSEKPNHNFEKK